MSNHPSTTAVGGLLRKGGAFSGGVYESGQYQRVADGLALRRGLTNTVLLGGGAVALSAALAAGRPAITGSPDAINRLTRRLM